MKKIFRFLSVVLIIASILSVVSCAERDREYNAEEVAVAAKALIESSELLNEIYYGKGIPYELGSSEGSYKYKPANIIWLDQKGFQTVDELKEMTRKVYTESLCNSIFAAKLGSMQDATGTIESFARYVQVYESEDPTLPRHILVDIKAEPIFVCENEYLYDTLKVTHSKGEKVYITVDVVVTRPAENGDDAAKTETLTLTLPLIEEENGWRISGYTFLNIM